MPVGVDAPEKVVGAWNPYRSMFDMVWSGRRHVVMGASQIDEFGNQNFAFIGSARPAAHTAARHAGRTRQHDQRPHVVLDPGTLDARVRARRRRRQRCRLRPGGRARRRRALPRDRAHRHQPRRPRLRDAGSPDALAFGAPGGHASTRSPRPRVSSSRWTVPSPSRDCRPTKRYSSSARSSIRTASANKRSDPDDPHAAVRRVRGRRPDRADRHGLGRRRARSSRRRRKRVRSASLPPRR